MEAMQYSLPIISTRWRGIPALVEEGVNGLLVEPQDPGAVAGAVERLAGDPELRARMGAAGRQTFEARFSVQQHLHAMEQAFLRLRP
jgi:glycosyltransferase involved in cell wall biosynthesis